MRKIFSMALSAILSGGHGVAIAQQSAEAANGPGKSVKSKTPQDPKPQDAKPNPTKPPAKALPPDNQPNKETVKPAGELGKAQADQRQQADQKEKSKKDRERALTR